MTVTYFDAITPGQKDYTAALVKVGTTHPDVLFYTGYYPEFGLLAKEYVALSPSYKLNGDSACADPSVIKVAGTAVTNPGTTSNIAFDNKGDRPTPQFLAVHAVGNPPQFQPIAIRQSGTWVASS